MLLNLLCTNYESESKTKFSPNINESNAIKVVQTTRNLNQ